MASRSISATRSASASVTATTAAQCQFADNSGACYLGFTAAWTWAEARAQCESLRPLGAWSLASIVDATTAASVRWGGNCSGALAPGSGYWIGLFDSKPGTRPLSVTNNTYPFWAWANPSADPSYFLANQASLWGSGEPNNFSPGQNCGWVYPGPPSGLDDMFCTVTKPNSDLNTCCQALGYVSATATRSVSVSASVSRSKSASRTVSRSASRSPSRSVGATASASHTPSPSLSPSATASATRTASRSASASSAACGGAGTVFFVSTLAGGGGADGTSFGSADGLGSAATFSSPWGVAVNGSGGLFVADYGNHLIRVISLSSVTTTLAGGGSAGGTAPGFADGVGSAALLFNPTGVAFSASATVYVADYSNHLIRAIAVSSKTVTTLAGGGSAGGTASGYADGVGSAALFKYPIGVAVDAAASTVFVADRSNNLIRAVSIASRAVATLAGGGSAGGVAFGYAEGVGSAAKFYNPYGIALDPAGGVLYVADYFNGLIRAVDVASKAVSTLAGGGSASGTATGTAPPAASLQQCCLAVLAPGTTT